MSTTMTKISLQDTVNGLPQGGDREIRLPSGNVIKIKYHQPVFPKGVAVTSDQLEALNKIPTVDLPPLESDKDGEND